MPRPSRATWQAESVLVGRAGELTKVRELLLPAIGDDRARGLFVVGEGGVGKTRLLAEARRLAADQGLRVAHAACLPLTT
jgi:Cdc6-like AAA superfamily ATPase